jgi:hypothetical protein
MAPGCGIRPPPWQAEFAVPLDLGGSLTFEPLRDVADPAMCFRTFGYALLAPTKASQTLSAKILEVWRSRQSSIQESADPIAGGFIQQRLANILADNDHELKSAQAF